MLCYFFAVVVPALTNKLKVVTLCLMPMLIFVVHAALEPSTPSGEMQSVFRKGLGAPAVVVAVVALGLHDTFLQTASCSADSTMRAIELTETWSHAIIWGNAMLQLRCRVKGKHWFWFLCRLSLTASSVLRLAGVGAVVWVCVLTSDPDSHRCHKPMRLNTLTLFEACLVSLWHITLCKAWSPEMRLRVAAAMNYGTISLSLLSPERGVDRQQGDSKPAPTRRKASFDQASTLTSSSTALTYTNTATLSAVSAAQLELLMNLNDSSPSNSDSSSGWGGSASPSVTVSDVSEAGDADGVDDDGA